jgi:ADP-ribosylglycohydrolase
MDAMITHDAILGSLLGTAVGDALGLPCEGLTPRRQRLLFGVVDRYHLWFGRGLVSDDTEHAVITAQALVGSRGEADPFVHDLGHRLRTWVLALPAGVGRATLAACFRLCLGESPYHSGVPSAGNGPSMRAAVLGLTMGDDTRALKKLVWHCSRVTHSDPRAEHAALAVAEAARLAGQGITVAPLDYYRRLELLLSGEHADEFLEALRGVIESVARGETTAAYSERLWQGRGVSGYSLHTVPAALHCWLRRQNDFRAAVTEIIACGGDTDTTAAIVGGIVGARVGRAGIPPEWINGLRDWPITVSFLESLAAAVAASSGSHAAVPLPELPFYQQCLRNVGFTVIVLLHGFRRLLPPY